MKSYPWNSPYSYPEGDVIRSIDLDGLEKYIIHQRSFAPWEYFGDINLPFNHYRYSGDNRGFTISTSSDIHSKVTTAVSVDLSTAKATVIEARQQGQTSRFDSQTGEKLKTAPTVTPDVELYNPQQSGSNTTIRARIEGRAPLAPIAALDPVSSLIDQPIVWTGTTTIDNHTSEGYVNIHYTLLGKGFPAFESFIEDEHGTKLFMGIYSSPAKGNIFQTLSNPEIAIRRDFNVKAYTDKDGNFMGIASKDSKGNDIVVNPAAYNKQFENVPPAADVMANGGVIKN